MAARWANAVSEREERRTRGHGADLGRGEARPCRRSEAREMGRRAEARPRGKRATRDGNGPRAGKERQADWVESKERKKRNLFSLF